MLTSSSAHTSMNHNVSRFGSANVMSFATVNVKNFSVSDKLKKLSRELLSKQDAGSNNNNGLGSFRL
jgi:hypothetical protein